MTLRFTGKSIAVIVKNHRLYNIMDIGYILDGAEGKLRIQENDREILLEIADELPEGAHTLTVFKRQDATHFYAFFGAVVDKDAEILPALPKPVRRMECFGDSVSAGAVCEAHGYEGQIDPENHEGVFDNAWRSYAMITARNLGAELHNTAQGGIAILDGTGYYHAPEYIGMETAYDKLCYFPEGGKITAWDFSRFTPHVVIFAVGQNDPHKEGFPDNNIAEPAYRHKWKSAYKRIVADLMQKYPKAHFVLITTVLMHDAEWDRAIDEIHAELNDTRVHRFVFTRNGAATHGHPRISEQYEMAEELTAYLSLLGDGIWEE